MCTPLPKRGRLPAGAFWLLALVCLAPRSAEAACGAAHDRPVIAIGLAEFGTPAALERERDTPAGFPATPSPSPCPGGICSRGEPVPIAPTSHAPKQRSEHWPCLADARLRLFTSNTLAVADVPLVHDRPLLAAPDRPPRRS